MTIIASNVKALVGALQRQGFFLVADLPTKTSIEIRRGMLVVKLP